jgi:hypothetical protein
MEIIMNVLFEFNPKKTIITYLHNKYDLSDNQIDGLIVYPSLLSKIGNPGITRAINLLRLLSTLDNEESDRLSKRKLAIFNYIALTHEYTTLKWAPNLFGKVVIGTLRDEIFNAYKIHYHLPNEVTIRDIEVHLLASTHGLYPILAKHAPENKDDIVYRLKSIRDKLGAALETYDLDLFDNNELLNEIPTLLAPYTPPLSSSSSGSYKKKSSKDSDESSISTQSPASLDSPRTIEDAIERDIPPRRSASMTASPSHPS